MAWERIRSGLLLTALMMVGQGCEENTPPAPTQASASKPADAKVLAPGPKLEVPSIFGPKTNEYTYNPVGKRDPFRRYEGELIQDVALPTSPLERFDLGQLKVTAIVWGLSSPRGLIQAPDGQSYIVRKEMRMGKHRGRISRITRREIYIQEEYRDPSGKLVVRESVLEIRAAEKEKKVGLSMETDSE